MSRPSRRQRQRPDLFVGPWGRMQRPPARSTAERKRRKWAKKAARRAVRAAAAERARLAIIDTSAAVWPMVEADEAFGLRTVTP